MSKAIDMTIEFLEKAGNRNAVSSDRLRSGLLAVNCYFLLSDAYKRQRNMEDSRTHHYKVAAFMSAAVMVVRPLRIRQPDSVTSSNVALANEHCALRLATSILGVVPEKLEEDFIRRLYRSVLGVIDLPSLGPYLGAFENVVLLNPKQDTFEKIEEAIPFSSYANLTLSDDELRQLDVLINMFCLLQSAHGDVWRRLLKL